MSPTKTPKLDYRWNLRLVMASRGMYATTDLVPLLADRGIVLSREQVYRLVTKVPERLSLAALVALCDILDCTPNELIEPVTTAAQIPTRDVAEVIKPLRARVAKKR